MSDDQEREIDEKTDRLLDLLNKAIEENFPDRRIKYKTPDISHLVRADLRKFMSLTVRGYTDEVNRMDMKVPEDVRYLRSLYGEQWTATKPEEIVFPSGLTIPREYFAEFLKYNIVPGKLPKSSSEDV